MFEPGFADTDKSRRKSWWPSSPEGIDGLAGTRLKL